MSRLAAVAGLSFYLVELWFTLKSNDGQANMALLSRVLAASPDDVPVRRMLIDLELSHAEYATHHLVEGTFLGDPEATRAALARATTLVEASPQPEAVVDLSSEIKHIEGLVADWLAYCAAPEGSFPDWCAARGRAYQWPTVVYYDEGAV